MVETKEQNYPLLQTNRFVYIMIWFNSMKPTRGERKVDEMWWYFTGSKNAGTPKKKVVEVDRMHVGILTEFRWRPPLPSAKWPIWMLLSQQKRPFRGIQDSQRKIEPYRVDEFFLISELEFSSFLLDYPLQQRACEKPRWWFDLWF